MVKRINPSAPAKTSNERPVAESDGVPQYEDLAMANLVVAAPGRFLQNDELNADMAMASFDLYQRLKPRDAQESILCMLTVGVTNASLDCLAQAALLRVDALPMRDLNLRHGLKGAAVAGELIKALDERRRQKPEKVTVGNVNVEAGGQAIVGTVEAPAPTKGQNNK